jgi:8-oxo-dGTP pyrophosphatase MutT (NUDIX family)
MSRRIGFIYPLLGKMRKLFSPFIRMKTMGARALVIDGEKVLLVKHTYQDGWYTVGGAVERGESPLEGIIRELWEEVGIKGATIIDLMGVYHSVWEKRDDYVALYIVKDFSMNEVQCNEILDKQWFNIADLPSDATPATKRRIEEYRGLRTQSDKW